MEENNRILEEIYEIREQQVLCQISDEEIKVRKELDKTDNEGKFTELLNKITDENLKQELKDNLDNLTFDIMRIACCDCERYYKQGFSDAINIIIESITMKKI